MKKLALMSTMMPPVVLADVAYPSNPMDDPQTALGVWIVPALSFLIGCGLVCVLRLCERRRAETRQSGKTASSGVVSVKRVCLVVMVLDFISLFTLVCLGRGDKDVGCCLLVALALGYACFTFWFGYWAASHLRKRWFCGIVLLLLAAGGLSFLCVGMVEIGAQMYVTEECGWTLAVMLLNWLLGFVAGFETGLRVMLWRLALSAGVIASCAFVIGTHWSQVVTECQTCISREYHPRRGGSRRRFEECPCCGGKGCHFRHPWRTPCTPCEEVFEKLRKRAEFIIGKGEGWDVHDVYDFAATSSFDRKVPHELENAMINRLRLMDLSDLFAAMKEQCADCGVDVESVNRLERWILSEGRRSDALLGKVEHFGGKRECKFKCWAAPRGTDTYTDCRLLHVFGVKVKVLYNFRRFYLAATEEGYPHDARLVRAIQDSRVLDEADGILEALDRKAWRTWSGWEQGCKLIDVFIDGARAVEPADERAIHALAEKLICRLKEMRDNDGKEF